MKDNDKVIEIRNDEERRTFQRRREDRGERKRMLFEAALRIYEKGNGVGVPDISAAVLRAEVMLDLIESREAERAKEGE